MKNKVLFIRFLFIALTLTGFSFTSKTNNDPKQGTQLEGTFMTKKGANDNIACHGTNMGVLILDTDERVILCFDELPGGKDLKIACKNLHVTGQYREHTIAGGSGACKPGKLTILYVEKWECMDGEE